MSVATLSLSLSLARANAGVLNAGRRDRVLIEDIISGGYRTDADLAARCAVAGLRRSQGESFVALAFGLRQGTPLRRAVAGAVEGGRRVLGGVIAAAFEDDVVVIGTTKSSTEHYLRILVDRFVDIVDAELNTGRDGGAVLAATVSLPAAGFAELGRCATEAREACALARRLGVRSRGLLVSDIGVHRLLDRLIDDPHLERFVLEQIGPVLEHDARRGTELLTTLDTYFTSGLSKTRAAEALGIRRQTLYARLGRLSEVLGGVDLERHERRSAIQIALIAWRLRTSSMFPVREAQSRE